MSATVDQIVGVMGGAAVTPGASPLPKAARALYIGVSGNVTVTTIDGSSITFTACPVGILPVYATHVTAATATNILALW